MEKLKNARVLVTGGCGFVGSHVVEALAKKTSRIIVPFRSVDPQSYFSTMKLSQKVILTNGDITDFRRMLDIIIKYEIDFIFHLAAQPIVTTAYDNPLETLSSNIMGTGNILEAARLQGKVKGIVVASSDKAYGKSDRPYVESDPLQGDHPYEVSKSSADLVAQMYIKTYGMPVVITRFGNIYGEGDLNFNRILPGIISASIRKESFAIRSNGTYKRDYLYVKDVVNGYITLASMIDTVKGEAFNFGSKENYSVLDVIHIFEKKMKKRIKYRILDIAKNEIHSQSLDSKKIQTIIGWKQLYTMKSILPLMYTWYRKIVRY